MISRDAFQPKQVSDGYINASQEAWREGLWLLAGTAWTKVWLYVWCLVFCTSAVILWCIMFFRWDMTEVRELSQEVVGSSLHSARTKAPGLACSVGAAALVFPQGTNLEAVGKLCWWE